KDVLADKYRQQGKAENVIEKIVESGWKTYYKEVCLLEQAFIHDNAKSVAQAVKEAEGKIGAAIKIAGFVRYALGEGIDRQESDFAAEVAAAAGPRRSRSVARFAPAGAGRSKHMAEPRYRRVIVKIGGEALSGPDGFGVHQSAV